MHRSSARHRAAVISADERLLPAAAARLARPLAYTLRTGGAVVEAVAFWLAALCPLAYLPLLAALHYAALDPTLVVGVVVGNLLALVIGHHYDPKRFDRDTAPSLASD